MPYSPSQQAISHAISIVTRSMKVDWDRRRFEEGMRNKKFNSIPEVIAEMERLLQGRDAWKMLIKQAERALYIHESQEKNQ